MAKLKAVLISETKTTKVLNVPAYHEKELVGRVKVTVWQENEAGLAAARKALTLEQVEDLNRQKITDAKNNLRRGISKAAALKKLSKENAKVARLVDVILKKAQDGTLTDAFLDSIGA